MSELQRSEWMAALGDRAQHGTHDEAPDPHGADLRAAFGHLTLRPVTARLARRVPLQMGAFATIGIPLGR